MKNVKTVYRFFSICQWKKEEKWLRKMANEGWKFLRIAGLNQYYFVRSEPEDIIYQLDYHPNGAYNNEEYRQLFEDCGWEYLQDKFGYSYFCKPASRMNGRDEEIFCDDESRIQMLNRIFKGWMVPLLAVFFLIILPQLFWLGHNDDLLAKALFVFYCVMFCIYLAIFILFTIQYVRLLMSIERQS